MPLDQKNETAFSVPQFLYYRIDDPLGLESLRNYFLDYQEVVQRCFKAFDISGIDEFTRRADFEGFEYVSGGISYSSRGDQEIPKGWAYKEAQGHDIVPDVTTPQGQIIQNQLDSLNGQLSKFYSSYKTKVLNIIGWPLRIAEFDIEGKSALEVDVSAFELSITHDQETLYLKINNPDYFRNPDVLDGMIPHDICHNVADILAAWQKPAWLIPTTEDEAKRESIPFRGAVKHTPKSFKNTRTLMLSP